MSPECDKGRDFLQATQRGRPRSNSLLVCSNCSPSLLRTSKYFAKGTETRITQERDKVQLSWQQSRVKAHVETRPVEAVGPPRLAGFLIQSLLQPARPEQSHSSRWRHVHRVFLAWEYVDCLFKTRPSSRTHPCWSFCCSGSAQRGRRTEAATVCRSTANVTLWHAATGCPDGSHQ